MRVSVGDVTCFDRVSADKPQAVKVLEEAAEVVEAWKAWEAKRRAYVDDGLVLGEPWNYGPERRALLDECSDVIQATCNLASALGVTDLVGYVAACEQRNRERGRITGGEADA